jgi:hypothetical protein
MPLMAKTTQERTRGVIANDLVQEFGKLSLRDLTPLTLQRYFSRLALLAAHRTGWGQL